MSSMQTMDQFQNPGIQELSFDEIGFVVGGNEPDGKEPITSSEDMEMFLESQDPFGTFECEKIMNDDGTTSYDCVRTPRPQPKTA